MSIHARCFEVSQTPDGRDVACQRSKGHDADKSKRQRLHRTHDDGGWVWLGDTTATREERGAEPSFHEGDIPPADLYKAEDTGDGGETWTLSGDSLIDGESVTAHIKHWRGGHPELTVTGSADEITVRPRLFNGKSSRHGWRYTRQIRQEVTE